MAKRPLSDRPEPRPERPGGHGYGKAILEVQASIVTERWLLEVPGAAEAVNAAVLAGLPRVTTVPAGDAARAVHYRDHRCRSLSCAARGD